jgi:hypothetical protein
MTIQIASGLLAGALAVAGMAVASEGDPTYDLAVAFDIPRARIIGTATIAIYFERGRSEMVMLQISGEHYEFRYLLNEKPVRIVLDENYDVFRRLLSAEIPPTINTLLTRPRVTLIASPAEEAKFSKLIDAFEREWTPFALYGGSHERERKGPPSAAAHFKQPSATTAARDFASGLLATAAQRWIQAELHSSYSGKTAR